MLKSMGSQRVGYDLVTEYQQKYIIQGSLVAQVGGSQEIPVGMRSPGGCHFDTETWPHPRG